MIGYLLIVSDDDDSPALFMEFMKEREDLCAGAGVEVAGGFIGEDEVRIGDDGARQRHALPLAAGEAIGLVAHAIRPVSYTHLTLPTIYSV